METTVEWMKPRIKSMTWNIRKIKTNESNKKKKKIQKTKDSVTSFWDNFNWFNIYITGVPEEERKSKKLEIYFKKIMKENFPNLVKEIDIQVQKAQSPKQDGWEEAHYKTHHH